MEDRNAQKEDDFWGQFGHQCWTSTWILEEWLSPAGLAPVGQHVPGSLAVVPFLWIVVLWPVYMYCMVWASGLGMPRRNEWHLIFEDNWLVLMVWKGSSWLFIYFRQQWLFSIILQLFFLFLCRRKSFPRRQSRRCSSIVENDTHHLLGFFKFDF